MPPVSRSSSNTAKPAGLVYTDVYATLADRDIDSSSTPTGLSPYCLEEGTCVLRPKTDISKPELAFIVTLTLLLIITAVSVSGLAYLLYRHWTRRRQSQEAKSWGRKSRYMNRVSVARQQLDDEYRRRYHGVLVNEHHFENPEMGSDSPVELGWEERVWEMPNVQVKDEKRLPPLPPVPAIPEYVRVKEGLGGARGGGGGLASGRESLFFCDGVGVWLPKR